MFTSQHDRSKLRRESTSEDIRTSIEEGNTHKTRWSVQQISKPHNIACMLHAHLQNPSMHIISRKTLLFSVLNIQQWSNEAVEAACWIDYTQPWWVSVHKNIYNIYLCTMYATYYTSSIIPKIDCLCQPTTVHHPKKTQTERLSEAQDLCASGDPEGQWLDGLL